MNSLLGSVRVEALRLLLDNGLDLRRKSNRGAIFVISQCSFVYESAAVERELLRLVLSRGANVEAVDSHNGQFTRLMHATIDSDLETMRMLFMAGADVHFVSHGGESVFSMCVRSEQSDVWVEALAYGAHPFDEWIPYPYPEPRNRGMIMYLLAEMRLIPHQPSAHHFTNAEFARDFKTSVYALSWQLFCKIAIPICFALQAIELPVLLTLEILDHRMPMAHMHAMHRKWKLIQTIKHFHAPLR
jgi:hypothetical protein